jgi:c-di-GMP-binding flagellar brake protein YcgR
MTSSKQTVERRKHKRFQLQIDTPVILRSHDTKAASIVDVSMGGLGFRCIGGEKLMCESMKISILPAENSNYLYKIPCRFVWNRKVEKDHYSSITTRRCGVQFQELTPQEVSQLEHFIQNYATGDT